MTITELQSISEAIANDAEQKLSAIRQMPGVELAICEANSDHHFNARVFSRCPFCAIDPQPYMPILDYQIGILIRDRMHASIEIAAHFTGHSVYYANGKVGERVPNTALGYWREWSRS